MSTMTLGYNKVLIRREGIVTSLAGFEVGDDDHTEHNSLPNIGVVEQVCKDLYCPVDRILEMRQQHKSRREISAAEHNACLFLTEIEAKPGDRVIYRRIMNVSDMENVVSGSRESARLIISHDDLIARINDDGSLYPLAGNVLIIDDQDSAFTTVIAAGKPVLRYFDFPFHKDPSTPLPPGTSVLANMKQAVPVGYSRAKKVGAAYILADESIVEPETVPIACIKRRHIHAIVHAPQSS